MDKMTIGHLDVCYGYIPGKIMSFFWIGPRRPEVQSTARQNFPSFVKGSEKGLL